MKCKRISKWKLSKLTVWRQQDFKCSICGIKLKFSEAVGHHVINKCDDRSDEVDNCEIRCVKDEEKMHKLYKNGNVK